TPVCNSGKPAGPAARTSIHPAPRMKTRTLAPLLQRSSRSAALFALAAGLSVLSAQETAPVPTRSAAETAAAAADANLDVVTLSPFEVSTAKDRGYRATNAISGSRI